MINEINERIRNKERFIYNVKCMGVPDSASITAKNVCMDEVAFLKQVLRYVDDLESSHATEDEIKQIRDRHGMLSKMLTEAAQIIDDQTEEINELKFQLHCMEYGGGV